MDGKRLITIGRYCSVPRPIKGVVSKNVPKDRALLELEDGIEVYLEPLDSPKSKRPRKELQQFDGKRVRVLGEVHAIMPSRGEGLLAPCISNVSQIVEDREQLPKR